MHFSAKRGIGIACRPCVRLSVRSSSVLRQISSNGRRPLPPECHWCPSVTLVDCDHIGWKSWKLISGTISPTSSLFVAQTPSTYSQGNMGKFGETRGGVGKMAFWSTKAAISLKRVQIAKKLL